MMDIIAYIMIAVVVLVVIGLAIYALYTLATKKKIDIAYVDKYKQLVEMLKLNCPDTIREKIFERSPDKRLDGSFLGYVQGIGNMQFKTINKKKKIFDLILFTTQKIRFWNPFTWNVKERVAVLDPEKHSSFHDHKVRWHIAGLDAESFFIFESGGDLTPNIIFNETVRRVDLKQANILLKKQSEQIESALEANPNIKGVQKLQSEIPLGAKR